MEPVEAPAAGVDLAAVRQMLAAIDEAKEARDRAVEVLPDALKRKARAERVSELQRPVDEATARLAQHLRGLGFGELSPVHVEQDGRVFSGRLGGHAINIDAPPPMTVEDGRVLFYVSPGLERWEGYAGHRLPRGDYKVDLEQLRPGHCRADVDAATGTADDSVSIDLVDAMRDALAVEAVSVPGNVPARLAVVQREAGWFYGATAELPEGTLDDEVEAGEPVATRVQALSAARDRLIRWLSDEKERGGKKHRRQAEELQDRVLEMSFREERPVAAAPAAAPPAGEGVVPALTACLFPLDRLVEAPNNPRGDLVEVGIEEMAASMRASGFRAWLPIVARELEDGTAMIAAGHRRSRAARQAGLAEVPCVVRPMTNAEFLDILNFDNGGREDVHPLYEASGWRAWMEATGKGVLDIAARIGKSKEYVYGRLKYEKLIPAAKKAFLEAKFKAEHAILIARRTESVQKAALTFLAPKWNGSIPTTRELENWLSGDQTKDLAEAKFDRGDRMLLAGVGDCVSCPKLQGNDPGFELPPATEDSEPEDLDRRPQDCCLDPLCFQEKTNTHFVQLQKSMEESNGGKPVLQVKGDWGTAKKGVLARDKYEVVKSGGQLALVVSGDHAGEAVRVKVKSAPAQESKAAAAERKDAEARAARERQEQKKIELAIRDKIVDAVVAAAAGDTLTRPDLQALLAGVLGNRNDLAGQWLCGRHGIENAGWQWGSRLRNVLPKWKDAELVRLALELSVAHEMTEWALDRPASDLLALARRHKVDAAKIRAGMESPEKGAEAGQSEKKVKKASAKKTPAKKAAARKAPPKLAPAARARIAAAQKRRWAEHRKRALTGGAQK
jgi:ParB family chromosome partitioning protein